MEIKKLNSKENLYTIDCVLSEIGLGRYHLFLFFTILLVIIIDSIQNDVIFFMQQIIIKDLNIENKNKVWWASTEYFGYLLGSFLSAYLPDKFGRKKCIIVSSLIIGILNIAFACVNSFITLIIVRFLFGIFKFFDILISITYLIEFLDIKNRGKVAIFLFMFSSLGTIILIFILELCSKNLQYGNWRFFFKYIF